MAKTDKATKEPRPEQDLGLAPEDRLTEILLAAIRVPARGVPVLIGPTQWGKTKKIRDVCTEKLGIKAENIVMMNPQNDLPEDIGGWPKRDGDWLSFTQPANIPPRLIDPKNYKADGTPVEPWAIFVDEIDKAAEDTLSSMLTFFNPDERRLRTTYINRRVPIFGAMNEPENRIIPEPLLARLLFLPYPLEGVRVSERPHLKHLGLIADELFTKLPEIRFPTRPTSPGSLHKLAEWTTEPLFWKDEPARRMIVRGLFSEKDAAVVLGKLRETLPEPSEEWANQVSPTDMLRHLIDVLDAGSYDAGVKVLRALVDRAQKDPTKETERALTAFLESPEALHAVHRAKFHAQGKEALVKKVGQLHDAVEQEKKDRKKSTT